MATEGTDRRYSAGTGWLVGMAVGLVLGVVGWWMTRQITMLLVVFVATGTALGYTLESSLDPTPLTPGQRRLVLVLLAVGVAVGGGVFLYASVFR